MVDVMAERAARLFVPAVGTADIERRALIGRMEEWIASAGSFDPRNLDIDYADHDDFELIDDIIDDASAIMRRALDLIRTIR